MPKMTKNMSITTDTLTMALMLRATDFRTNLMPDDLVSALRGRIARSIRSDRTAFKPPTDVSISSSSVVTTMKKSSWFVRSRMYRLNPNTNTFNPDSAAKHAVRT